MEKLEAQWARGKFVCVGLDSELGKIPKAAISTSEFDTVVNFNRRIINATYDLVCAYKLNAAFYEALGPSGGAVLWETINFIHKVAPEVPVILDAKRGDIGNTNNGYVTSAFGTGLKGFNADAITVNPYMGQESLQPFLDQKEKGIVMLCRTSNKGAREFQERLMSVTEGEASLLYEQGNADILKCLAPMSGGTSMTTQFARTYEIVAFRIKQFWNTNNNCLIVVGATAPEELARVRKIVGDLPILIPGIGAQGGDLEKTVKAGKDSHGQGMIINSSRGIIFASNGDDFAEAASRETQKLHEQIHQHLN